MLETFCISANQVNLDSHSPQRKCINPWIRLRKLTMINVVKIAAVDILEQKGQKKRKVWP